MTTVGVAAGVDEFNAVLRLPGRDGLPRIIVGGQAVNVWASRYVAVEPKLTHFFPFTSKDLDVLGQANDLQQLAQLTGWPVRPAQPRIFIPSAGYLEMPASRGRTIKVEVLKRLYGVDTREVESTALVITHLGMQLRVIHPLTLLRAKLENVVHLPQAKRQDFKHLQMMLLCTRAYHCEKLRDLESAVLSERDCVGLLEQTLVIAGCSAAKVATRKFGINWLDALPLEALRLSTQSRLRNFVEKRLPRWQTDQTKRQ